MASPEDAAMCTTNNKIPEDEEKAEEIEKLLDSVISKRKTFPKKCMDLHKHTASYEFKRLEHAQIRVEENKEAEKFRRMVNGLKRLKKIHFSTDDLLDAHSRLQKCYKKTKDIHNYLLLRQQHMKHKPS